MELENFHEYASFVKSSEKNMQRYINIVSKNLEYSLVRAESDEERKLLVDYSENLIKSCRLIIDCYSKDKDNEDIER